ncbi:MAG TPA: extracellular solute-binding protein [Pirellulaceae bacterium]|nr:extracellular solute-binding protein [Pirellulaceae bacterium]
MCSCRLLLVASLLVLSGCFRSAGSTPEVVVYAALDREFSEPVLDAFTAAEGIQVLAKYDIESTKTVGLTQALMSEAARPRCDVFWNNEILNTLRLERAGLLDVYYAPQAKNFPEAFRSPQGTWHGIAARARVLLVNTNLVPADKMPTSINDLADPQWQGKVGIAKPLFGTTATHAACLFAALGEEEAKALLRSLKQNKIQILSGNKQVALAVSAGQIAFGLTDTDDAIIELEQGQPVRIIYPDRAADQLGTLFIPNTLCILKDCPHPEAARKLVDYLLTPAVEEALANCPSAQIPLNSAVRVPSRVETPATVHAMPVDFAAAAEQWETAAQFIRDEFTAD